MQSLCADDPVVLGVIFLKHVSRIQDKHNRESCRFSKGPKYFRWATSIIMCLSAEKDSRTKPVNDTDRVCRII